MNQTFDFYRFWLVVQLELTEKRQKYFWTTVPILLYLFLMMFPITFSEEYSINRIRLHYAALTLSVLLGGSLFTSLAFDQYHTKNTALSALMVPASQVEKVLGVLLLNILFFGMLMGLFLILHSWTIDIANSRLAHTTISMHYSKISPTAMLDYWLFYVLLHGFVFLGSLYFKKSAYAKSIGSFILISAGLYFINQWFANYLTSYPTSLFTFPMMYGWQIGFDNSNHFYNIYFPDIIQKLLSFLPYAVLFSLWYITYVRLGEKEI